MEKSNIVKLTNFKVELIEKMTWGIQEQIRSQMYNGLKIKNVSSGDQNVEFDSSAIIKSKYKTIEVCIKKITDEKGEEVKFSVDWLDNLSVDDGDKLYAEINDIAKKK